MKTARAETKLMSAARLMKVAMPCEVKFAGGWKRVDAVIEVVKVHASGTARIIELRKQNYDLIAKFYPSTEVQVREVANA